MTEQPRSSTASRSRVSVKRSVASPLGRYPGRLTIAAGIFRDGLRATTKSADRATAAAGDNLPDCIETLNITRPKMVAKAHRTLLRAGAEILFTNTSGAATQLLDRYRVQDEAFAISYLGAEIASTVARETTQGKDRPRVVGDVRIPWHLPVHGFIPKTEVETAAASMTSAQVAGGVDAICLRTSQNPAHLAAAFNGARAGMAEAGRAVPVLASVRREGLGLFDDPEQSLDALIATGHLAHSLGAAALSLDTSSLGADAAARLIAFAAALDGPLIITPGASKAVVQACFANQNLARRFAFVGAETPTQAWRLSRFMAATASQPTSQPVPDSANTNDGVVFGRAPNPSWRGVA
jgi:methionine synthase I (cobalamin-dependent)